MKAAATAINAAGLVWNIEQGAALLAVDALHRAAFIPDDAQEAAAKHRRGSSSSTSSLAAIVTLCRAGINARALPANRKNASTSLETQNKAVDDDDAKTSCIPLSSPKDGNGNREATGSGRSGFLVRPRCENWLLANAVLKSMAMLVGVPAAAATKVGPSSSTRGTSEGNRPKTLHPNHNPHQNESPLSSPPLPLPPLLASDAGDHIERRNIQPDRCGGLSSPPLTSLPPSPPGPTGMSVLPPVARVEASLVQTARVLRANGDSGDQTIKNDKRATIDKDNSRRLLFRGVLSLLVEIFEKDDVISKHGESEGEEGGSDLGNRDHQLQRAPGRQESESLVWVSDRYGTILFLCRSADKILWDPRLLSVVRSSPSPSSKP